jgi:hypothetical protein
MPFGSWPGTAAHSAPQLARVVALPIHSVLRFWHAVARCSRRELGEGGQKGARAPARRGRTLFFGLSSNSGAPRLSSGPVCLGGCSPMRRRPRDVRDEPRATSGPRVKRQADSGLPRVYGTRSLAHRHHVANGAVAGTYPPRRSLVPSSRESGEASDMLSVLPIALMYYIISPGLFPSRRTTALSAPR